LSIQIWHRARFCFPNTCFRGIDAELLSDFFFCDQIAVLRPGVEILLDNDPVVGRDLLAVVELYPLLRVRELANRLR
jgi:hypothetical protein